MRTSKRSYQTRVAWKYPVFTLLVVLAIGFALPAPSIAKSDNNGAYTFKDSYCFDYNDTTVCYANSGIIQRVTTPSGNTAYFGIGTSSYEEIDSSGMVLYSDTLSYHTQGLNKDEAAFNLAQSFSEVITVGGTSCKTTYQFHLVKGEITFDRSTFCG